MIKNNLPETNLRLSDFYYDLPEERIAQTPAEPRDSSRLMVLNRTAKTIEHKVFSDILDYISNYCLMPVVSIATCIMVGWILKPGSIIDEVKLGGLKFSRQSLYVAMIKFVAPAMLILLLMQSLGVFSL